MHFINIDPNKTKQKTQRKKTKTKFCACLFSKQDADNERQDSPVDGDEVIELVINK